MCAEAQRAPRARSALGAQDWRRAERLRAQGCAACDGPGWRGRGLRPGAGLAFGERRDGRVDHCASPSGDPEPCRAGTSPGPARCTPGDDAAVDGEAAVRAVEDMSGPYLAGAVAAVPGVQLGPAVPCFRSVSSGISRRPSASNGCCGELHHSRAADPRSADTPASALVAGGAQRTWRAVPAAAVQPITGLSKNAVMSSAPSSDACARPTAMSSATAASIFPSRCLVGCGSARGYGRTRTECRRRRC